MTREEAINILKTNNPFLGGDEYEMLSKAMDMAVSAFQTDSDTVSRQTVIDLIARSMNNLEYDNENEELQSAVMALPSAQPEPEDCDTCKHGYFGDEKCDNCRMRYPNHYERRTDDGE